MPVTAIPVGAIDLGLGEGDAVLAIAAKAGDWFVAPGSDFSTILTNRVVGRAAHGRRLRLSPFALGLSNADRRRDHQRGEQPGKPGFLEKLTSFCRRTPTC